MVILLLTLVAIPLTGFLGLFVLPFLWLAVGFFYRVLTLAARSATPGMALMGIEFRNFDGQRFDKASAFLHTAFFTFFFGVVVVQVLSIILMLTTPRGQGLGDMLMGTVAINRRGRR